MKDRITALVAAVLTVALLSPQAHATEFSFSEQDPVSSLDELGLKVGEKIIVIRADGSLIKGVFWGVYDKAVRVQTKDGLVTIREERIYQIHRLRERRGRGRGALMGALIGAGVAAGGGLFFLAAGAEEGAFGMGFAIIGLASIPSGAAVGAIVSGEKKDLVFRNPNIPAPLAAAVEGLYFNVSAGPNLIGKGPGPGATVVGNGSSKSLIFQGLYRATPHWGFGGELLLTKVGPWQWEQTFDDGYSFGMESRTITAPGFNIYYFPLTGKHELSLVGGFSVFHQKAPQYREWTHRGQHHVSMYEETKLDYFMKAGVGYHYYVHPRVGVGGEVDFYKGTNFPDPMVRFTVSLSFRVTSPGPR